VFLKNHGRIPKAAFRAMSDCRHVPPNEAPQHKAGA